MAGRSLSSQPARAFRFTPGVIRHSPQPGVLTVLEAPLLFVPAGRLNWAEGWIAIGFYLFFIELNAALLLPALFASRWTLIPGFLLAISVIARTARPHAASRAARLCGLCSAGAVPPGARGVVSVL